MANYYVTSTGSDSNAGTSEVAAFLTPGKATGTMSGGDRLNIKLGTYPQVAGSANVSGGYMDPPAGSSGAPTIISGYHTTPGDLDNVYDFTNFPTIQVASGGSAFGVRSFNSFVWFENLIIDGNSLASYGFLIQSNNNRVTNTKIINCGLAYYNPSVLYSILHRIWVSNCATGILTAGQESRLKYCVVTGATNVGFQSDGAIAEYSYCLAYLNLGATTDGFLQTNGPGAGYFNCVSCGNGRDGIRLADAGSGDTVMARNNILYGNGGFGLHSVTTNWPIALGDFNFYGANTSGSLHQVGAGANDVLLTGNPFTNTAVGDFSLNNTAGAGAACRAAGFPGIFPGALTTGYLDGGAAQHTAVAPPVQVVWLH